MLEELYDDVHKRRNRAEKVTESDAILRILRHIAEDGETVMVTERDVDRSFLAYIDAVDARRGMFTLANTRSAEFIRRSEAAGAFDVFVPSQYADVLFESRSVDNSGFAVDLLALAVPETVLRWRRRQSRRGPCFGLVEIWLRSKGEPSGDAIKATIRDISKSGVGFVLDETMRDQVVRGSVFDEAYLVLSGKPIATCKIEITRVYDEPKTQSLLAGGLLLELDELSEKRVYRLVEALRLGDVRENAR